MPICASICDFGATGSVTYFPMCPVCAMAGGGIHAVCTVVNIISVIGHCGRANDTETCRSNFILGFLRIAATVSSEIARPRERSRARASSAAIAAASSSAVAGQK